MNQIHNAYPLDNFPGITDEGAYNALVKLVNDAVNETSVSGHGLGYFKTFDTLQNIPNMTRYTQELFLNLIRNNISYINKDFLPTVLTREMFFKTNMRELEYAELSEVPALGPSRTFRFQNNQNISMAKRYGVSIFMEADFASTPEGCRALMVNLLVVRDLAIEQMAMLGFATLFEGNPRNQYTGVAASLNNSSINYLMTNDYLINSTDHFCMVNKSREGLALALKMASAEISILAKVRPDKAIMPFGKTALLLETTKQHTTLDNGGQSGLDSLFNASPEYHLCGMRIYEAPIHKPDTRNCNINVRNDFFTEVRLGAIWLCQQEPGQNDYENLMWGFYDVNADTMKFIKSIESVLACQVFEMLPNGFFKIKAEFVLGCYQYDDILDDLVEFLITVNDTWVNVPQYHQYKNNHDEETATLLENGIELDWYINTLTNSNVKFRLEQILKFFEFVKIRPSDGYLTNSVIVCKGGENLGFTAHGNESLTEGGDSNILTRTHEWRATIGTHIINYNMLKNIRDVIYGGIIGGGNCKLVKTTADIDLLSGKNFEATGDDPSIFVLLCKKGKFSDIDIAVSFFPEQSQKRNRIQEPSKIPYFKFYCAVYKWAEEHTALARWLYKGTKEYYVNGVLHHINGNTHHGPYEGTGCRTVRRTGTSYVPSANLQLR